MDRQAISLELTYDLTIGVAVALGVLPRNMHVASYPGYTYYYSFAKHLAVALR